MIVYLSATPNAWVRFEGDITSFSKVFSERKIQIAPTAKIGDFCLIGDQVVIGDNCVIESHAHLGRGAVVPDGCRVDAKEEWHPIVNEPIVNKPLVKTGKLLPEDEPVVGKACKCHHCCNEYSSGWPLEWQPHGWRPTKMGWYWILQEEDNWLDDYQTYGEPHRSVSIHYVTDYVLGKLESNSIRLFFAGPLNTPKPQGWGDKYTVA